MCKLITSVSEDFIMAELDSDIKYVWEKKAVWYVRVITDVHCVSTVFMILSTWEYPINIFPPSVHKKSYW